MSKPISILVVDDHVLFRRGLITLLDDMSEFKVVGEAADGAEAITAAHRLKPDLVLMDVNMPGMDGVSAIPHLRELRPAPRILMLTISQNDQDLLGAIVNGADGYLLKNTDPESLRSTILQVMHGNSILSPEVTGRVLQAVRLAQVEREQSLLSDREIEVLRCLARGQTTPQVAAALFISENTVKTHIRHILEKLEVNNRAEAVARAAQMHLL